MALAVIGRTTHSSVLNGPRQLLLATIALVTLHHLALPSALSRTTLGPLLEPVIVPLLVQSVLVRLDLLRRGLLHLLALPTAGLGRDASPSHRHRCSRLGRGLAIGLRLRLLGDLGLDIFFLLLLATSATMLISSKTHIQLHDNILRLCASVSQDGADLLPDLDRISEKQRVAEKISDTRASSAHVCPCFFG
jgi:hypothetical protein